MDHVQFIREGNVIATFRTYYALTKPGIIFGNLLTALGGFFLIASANFSWSLLFFSMSGLSLIIAAGCVANNHQDRFCDSLMQRTKNRPLVLGIISPRKAFFFATSLLLLGSVILAKYTNWITLLVALCGFFVYVFLYTPLKHKSYHATLVGAIAGSTPPVIGYCAVHGTFDFAAFLLFAITTFWQMPHFFAIALYRMRDYQQANIPVLPIQKGSYATKIQMFLYLVAFAFTTPLLYVFHYTNLSFFIVTTLCNLAWIQLSLKGFFSSNEVKWSKQMFLFSLIAVTLINSLLIINYFL